jgi:hypothetical protein
MTVQSQVTKVEVLGNDAATSFSFSPMVIFASSDLVVTKVDANSTETTLAEGSSSTTYAVVVSSYPDTGSITYPAVGGTPLATGESLIIKRVLTLEQQTDLENQGGYFPAVQERAFDKLTMMVLQQQEILNRSFKTAVSVSTSFDVELPSNIESSALQAVIVNAAGTGLTLGTAATAPVSSFWTPVVADENLADSLSQLGFSAVVQAILQDTTATAIATELDVLENGLLTTRGDIIRRGTSAPERVALGASGKALVSDGTDAAWAYVPFSGVAGMKLSQDTDTAHDVNITAGECYDATFAERMVLGTEITKQIDAAWAVGDDAGGLDTGAIGNNEWIYIWLIKRSDTGVVDALFSLSATAPTMPTNYDFKRLIGFVVTDGSANIYPFTHIGGDYFRYDTYSADVSDATITSGTWETATLAAPAGSRADVYIQGVNTTETLDNAGIYLRWKGASDSSASFKYSVSSIDLDATPEIHGQSTKTVVFLDGNSQCEYTMTESVGTATVFINTLGFEMITRSHP